MDTFLSGEWEGRSYKPAIIILIVSPLSFSLFFVCVRVVKIDITQHLPS